MAIESTDSGPSMLQPDSRLLSLPRELHNMTWKAVLDMPSYLLHAIPYHWKDKREITTTQCSFIPGSLHNTSCLSLHREPAYPHRLPPHPRRGHTPLSRQLPIPTCMQLVDAQSRTGRPHPDTSSVINQVPHPLHPHPSRIRWEGRLRTTLPQYRTRYQTNTRSSSIDGGNRLPRLVPVASHPWSNCPT